MFVVKNIPAIFSNCFNVTRALGVVEREKIFPSVLTNIWPEHCDIERCCGPVSLELYLSIVSVSGWQEQPVLGYIYYMIMLFILDLQVSATQLLLLILMPRSLLSFLRDYQSKLRRWHGGTEWGEETIMFVCSAPAGPGLLFINEILSNLGADVYQLNSRLPWKSAFCLPSLSVYFSLESSVIISTNVLSNQLSAEHENIMSWDWKVLINPVSHF